LYRRPGKDSFMIKRVALFVAVALGLPLIATAPAFAQHRSPLADAPAIRKRVEFRASRLEIGVGAGSTVNQTFNHAVLMNVRLGFHITDWLAISGFGGFNVAQLKTSFNSRLQDTLPDNMADGRAPTQSDAAASINKIAQVYAGQVELTPFAGKYSLFGKLFANYDFYGFAGPAYVTLAAASSGRAAPGCGSTPQASCVAKDPQIGATFGFGIHSFFNRFVALNAEFRDVYFKDNAAGRDVNGVKQTSNSDLTWNSNVMVLLGITLFVPPTPDITD